MKPFSSAYRVGKKEIYNKNEVTEKIILFSTKMFYFKIGFFIKLLSIGLNLPNKNTVNLYIIIAEKES